MGQYEIGKTFEVKVFKKAKYDKDYLGIDEHKFVIIIKNEEKRKLEMGDIVKVKLIKTQQKIGKGFGLGVLQDEK